MYYTSHDIERKLMHCYPDGWYEKWISIDVFIDETIIYLAPDYTEEDIKKSNAKLRELFGFHFQEEASKIMLDFGNNFVNVLYESAFDVSSKVSLPLFKELKRNFRLPEALHGVPVLAFHSYKGGVGRTLSLLAATKSLSSIKSNSSQAKLLIIDADIEAPGLTWLAQNKGLYSDISLLDALSLLHQNESWQDECIDFVAMKIKENTLRIPMGEQEVEHYFLPSYRSLDQIFTMPITPETIIQMNEREWILGDFFSRLGKKLNVDAVLIDLRAGVSEFASPLLFDPRIHKIFVTSTSLQSRYGIQTILKQIYDNPLDESHPLPTVFFSMVPDEVSNNDRSAMELEIIELFKEYEQSDDAASPPKVNIEFLPFASNLVHLEGLNTIDRKLSGTEMYKIIDNTMQNIFGEDEDKKKKAVFNENDKIPFLNKLIRQTTEMEHAETTLISDFLTTTALKNLARKYRYSVPISVILGAKGSGKTFAYLQLLRSGLWENFIGKIDDINDVKTTTHIVPFLKPKSLADESIEEISSNMKALSDSLGFKMTLQDMEKRIDDIDLFFPKNNTEAEWKEFWRTKLLECTGISAKSFDELQTYLEERQERITFTVDGLEEIFQKVSTDSREKTALRAFTQGIVNELRSIPDSRIGLLVFVRRDVAINAIEQNWGQFFAQYEQYELKWTHVEALRLALWLCTSIEPIFNSLNVPIESATREILEESLHPLWGVKLGRLKSNEAYSANWIIAVLSDLNQQLQARDIIRFLRYAAEESLGVTTSTDRYLAPAAIRNAIKPCSDKKIEEIGQEMPTLADIFNKLCKKPVEQRQVPFQLEDYKITSNEARLLEQQGYLVKLDDGYYMPEIIRKGLDFSLQRGARPKVFSLLKRAQRKN